MTTGHGTTRKSTGRLRRRSTRQCRRGDGHGPRPRRHAGVLALSGGLLGPPGTTWDDVTANLDGTPVFLGCSDVDPHIPAARVIESEKVFKRLGARVTRKLYSGMG